MKFILIILLAANAYAQDASKVCHEIIEQKNAAQTRLSTLNLIRGLLFPAKIVQMKQLRTAVEYVKPKLGHDHLILNILKNEDLNVDMDELHKNLEIYNKIASNVKENVFAKRAAELNNFEECMNLSLEVKQDFIKFLQLSGELDLYSPYHKQFERLESFYFVKKKINMLLNRGWILHETLDIKTLNIVMNSEPEQVAIISHTTSNGVIIDANDNALPASIFANTPVSLRKLSLFSCNVEQTQKTYQLEKLVNAERFDLIYPIVRPAFKTYFENSTPLLALSALAKYHKNKNLLPVRTLEQNCSITFDQDNLNMDLAIYINNQFIGLLSDIRQRNKKFYCDVLKDENSVSFNLIDKKSMTSENIRSIPNSLIINNGNHSISMNLKHFFRENQYLSSKTIKEKL